MKSFQTSRQTIVPDPVLGPLLERLAILESANYRLKSSLSERSFNVEVENSALSERLARANEEIARHQGILENMCCEILAAVQARDRAQATADESLKVRTELISQLENLGLQLDDAQKACLSAAASANESLKVRAELLSQRDILRLQLDDALKACTSADARDSRSRRTLEDYIHAAQAAADESLGVRLDLVAERDRLLLQLDDVMKASSAAEARGAQIRCTLEEYMRAAQAAAEASFKARAETASQCDSLKLQLNDALKASSAAEARGAQIRGTLEEYMHAAQAAADESLRVRLDLVAERDRLLLQLDDALKACSSAEARDSRSRRTLEDYIHAARAAAEASFKARAEMASQCDSLKLQLNDALKARSDAGDRVAAGSLYPSSEFAFESGWARLLRLLKPPLKAAYAHLRHLSTGPMSAGQRAILRMTGSSLSEVTDSLATIDLALTDSSATTDTTPILPVLESALGAWEAVFRRRGIALTREISRTMPDSPHDPEHLRLALHHVLRNAAEALARGMTLRVHLRKSAEDAVEIEFRDDGPGYPSAWLERRFEPFIAPRQGHAGLGLAAVRRALRRWGGDAAAANVANGHGACLTLTFAAAPPRPAVKP